jgi:hypothetical protein
MKQIVRAPTDGRPLRVKFVGVSAFCAPPDLHAFRTLWRMLQSNTHFNGAAEMLERIECALKHIHNVEFPKPSSITQNANMTLGLVWGDDFSILVSNTTIVWRFAKSGEPHAVNDAATAGVPHDVINALAHISRMGDRPTN